MDTDTTPEAATTESGGSRRELFAKAGAAAAVAAVAGLAVSERARAANGDNFIVGGGNTATANTNLSGGTSLIVFDGTSSTTDASIRGTSSADDHTGVRGDASGSAGTGVWGRSTGDNGRAVFGENNGDSGYGVRGENDASGGFGVYGLHSASGTDSAGVFGRNTGSGHGVWGSADDSGGAGVYGFHDTENGIGVYGNHSNASQAGIGVLGVASQGSGVVGRGTEFDLLADRSGKVALSKASTITATANGTVGTIARDADGNLWYCYATDMWEQLSGIVAPGAPPQFTSIPPIRAYDSRIGAIPNSGIFAANSNKVISIKDGRDQITGVIDAPNAVPAGVTAVAYNVTATNTTAGSFLRVVPGDVATSAVSSLNWTGPGISIANAGIVGVDGSRQVRILAGPAGTFDAIIDITGYWS